MTAGPHLHDDHPTTVAVQHRLTSPRPLPAPDWQAALERLVVAAAEGCDAAGAVVLGHIKAFAALPGGYVRASAVDTAHEPTSEAHASLPAETADVTLNALVYGLTTEIVRHAAEASFLRLAADSQITITTTGGRKDRG
jgi:hypothetical protein